MRYLDPWAQEFLARLTVDGGSDHLYVKFLEQVIPQVNIGALKRKSRAVVSAILRSMYSMLVEYRSPSPQVCVENVSYNNTGHDCKVTAVRALNIDMPFILKSMIEIMRGRHAPALYILHPVLCVKRNENGALLDIVSADCGGVDESLIYLEIEYMGDDVAELKAALIASYTSLAERFADGNEAIKKFQAVSSDFAKVASDAEELLAFKDWVTSGNFIFFGYSHYGPDDAMALLGSAVADEICSYLRVGTVGPLPGMVFKYLSCIDMVEMANGSVVGLHRFFGLLSSNVQYQSVADIPVLRRKMEQIKACSNVKVGGHSHRMILGVLQSLPRQLLFLLSTSEVLEDVMSLTDAIWSTNAVAIFRVFHGIEDKCFAYVTLCAPDANWTTKVREDVSTFLREKIGAEVVEIFAGTREYGILRESCLLKVDRALPPEIIAEVSSVLVQMLKSWDDSLRDSLTANVSERFARSVMAKWRFSDAYKEAFSTKDAYRDIIRMEKLKSADDIITSLQAIPGSSKLCLKIYTKDQYVDLSTSMPIVENMSMRVLDHHSYCNYSAGNKTFWIHNYTMLPVAAEEVDIEHIRPIFEETLSLVMLGKLVNSSLNKLTIRAGLEWRSIFLISALAAYFRQLGSRYTDTYVQDVLVRHSDIVSMLLELFEIRLNPKADSDREAITRVVIEKIEERIGTIDNVADDSIMRSMLEIVGNAIVRTNYYQDSGNKSYVSFKILSSLISMMPMPKPFAEIFVYSSMVEGIHLRGDRVSRGGLRWSDRPQDYRTEVLGLMKAQVAKNSIIVPSGAKGGFVVKGLDPTSMTRDAYSAEVVNRYRIFLDGLLDITDNIVGGSVQRPADVTCIDNEDPYLVVAADKGTATFSDIANQESEKYKFWLGDAFASGGSAGYDHKKMAITSRGAWVSVEHNLGLMHINLAEEPITVVAIGDMSGDVFGNGMLRSNNIKLVAAFNHMHIFLDPNPDPKLSYQERARLFALPRSTWDDYDRSTLSTGAMIISRQVKNIALTPEVSAILGLEGTPKMTPNEIVTAILCMDVTLLWNGGIGVYVKSEKEINDKIGDRSNDEVRINGKQLKAKMFIEGGNLGVTQLGRIEYSKCGGLINADFIDNCAGVHCSDREVNIKIALAGARAQGLIDLPSRNTLLEMMQEEVADMVLHDNFIQVNALRAAELRCKKEFSSYCRLVDRLENLGILDSEVEFIPSAAERAKMAIEGAVFTRPELAVLLSYSKIWLRKEIIQSNLPDEDFCTNYLVEYFPVPMRKGFSDSIKQHPLRREIIANFIAGMIVNRMGITVVNDIMDALGVSADVVARAHIVVRESVGIQWMFDRLALSVRHDASSDVVSSFLYETSSLIEYMVRWVIRRGGARDIAGDIEYYSACLSVLRDNLALALPAGLAEQHRQYRDRMIEFGLSKDLGQLLSTLSVLAGGLDVITIAAELGLDLLYVAQLHFRLEELLEVGYLKRLIMNMGGENHWRKMSMVALFDELSDVCASITKAAIVYADRASGVDEACELWQKRNALALSSYKDFFAGLSFDTADIHVVLLLVRHLKNLAVKV